METRKNMIGRRGFIKGALLASSAFLLTQCTRMRKVYYPPHPGEGLEEPVSWWPEQVGAPLPKDVTSPVAIARAEDHLSSVKKAIELAGGLSFVKEGQRVLLKPAVDSGNPFPATTSPEVISELVKMLKERGATRIIVADKSGPFRRTDLCMRRNGILKAAQEAGAEVHFLEQEDFVRVRPSSSVHWPTGFLIPRLFFEVDHIINLPTVRTHFLMEHTMALKNMMGILPRVNRIAIHLSLHSQEKIAEVSTAVRPSLIVLDGWKVFTSGGPDHGHVEDGRLVIAGRDPVACDAVGLALLKSLGTTEDIEKASVWQRPQVKWAGEIGLGVSRPEQIQLMPYGLEEGEVEVLKRYLV